MNPLLRRSSALSGPGAKIYHRIVTSSDVGTLQQNLDLIFTWCNDNKLYLNIDKCCSVIYTRKVNFIRSAYHINNTSISSLSSVKDLGVVFDSSLAFAGHISAITISAHKILGFIIRTCNGFTNIHTIITLFYALVVSKLEYASEVWFPIYRVYSNVIERIQRKFPPIRFRTLTKTHCS